MTQRLHFAHTCKQGGPAQLPVTWDRKHGGAQVECPVCGKHALAAALRGHRL